jgi:hypothetical protein
VIDPLQLILVGWLMMVSAILLMAFQDGPMLRESADRSSD